MDPQPLELECTWTLRAANAEVVQSGKESYKLTNRADVESHLRHLQQAALTGALDQYTQARPGGIFCQTR